MKPVCTFVCRICDRELYPDSEDLHNYAARGWPKCCGAMMMVASAPPARTPWYLWRITWWFVVGAIALAGVLFL